MLHYLKLIFAVKAFLFVRRFLQQIEQGLLDKPGLLKGAGGLFKRLCPELCRNATCVVNHISHLLFIAHCTQWI